MELRQLRYFLEVASQGSFTAAAETLNISQPALGTQVAKLEAELGVALLHRHPRGAALTEEGERYQERVRDVLSRLQAANDEIRQDRRDLRGRVRIGIIPSFGLAMTFRIIDKLRHRYPEITPVFTEDFSDGLNAMVQDGRIDLALSYSPIQEAGFSSLPLFSEQLVLMGSPATLGQLADPLPLQDALHHSLALDRRSLILRATRALGLEPDRVVEIASMNVRRAMVMRGEVCLIGPLAFLADFIETGQVAVRQIIGPRLWITLHLNYRNAERLPQREKVVHQAILDIVQEHVENGQFGWVPPFDRPSHADISNDYSLY